MGTSNPALLRAIEAGRLALAASRIYESATRDPTPADGEGRLSGAWWVRIDGSGAQTAQWRWDGAAWVPAPFSPTIIPALLAGSVTTEQLAATAIDGMTITGSIIQTLAAANRGVKLSPAGIEAFNASGTRTFYVNPSTGALTCTSGTFSGNVTGANITGSSFTYDGDGSAEGWRTTITKDGSGAYMGYHTPDSTTPATIRANTEDFNIGPALVLRSPAKSTSGYTSRAYVNLQPAGSAQQPQVTLGGMVVTRNVGSGGGGILMVGDPVINGNGSSVAINDFDDGSGTAASIKSLGVHGRTYTQTANTYVTSNGYMGRSTSKRAAKVAIEPLPDEQVEALLSLDPVWWYDRGDAERLAEWVERTQGPRPALPADEVEDVPPTMRRIPGLIAEDVHDAGATAFATYDDDGAPNGVAYDRIGLTLLAIVREQREQIAALTERITALEAHA